MSAPKPPPPVPSAPPPVEGDAVQLLDALVRLAIRERASDIHLEPKQDVLKVRLRVDGAMVDVQSISLSVAQQIVGRVKVLARMDIAERRLPQDGQISMDLDGKRVHLRASTFPSMQGEKAVLRILAGTRLALPFDRLGLDPEAQTVIREAMSGAQGFVITCGPTGAGKTSTLYALLELVKSADVNVVTLEDPVEVELYNITQGQVHVRAGFTFAAGLRAILRQDPDVILVGEMRDEETAGIALQAALTGHLVLSTLHTSSSVETIVRLIDLGVEPWIVANALSCVLSQRLVRMACKQCIDSAKLEIDFKDGNEVLIPAGSKIVRPRGCNACMKTGYRGRTGIFETLTMDDEIRELVKDKAQPRAYKELFARRKIKTLRRAGFERILAGVTTVDEVRRVT